MVWSSRNIQSSEYSNVGPCALVLLNALHSDTKQIKKSGTFRENGVAAVKRYQSNPRFLKWMNTSASMRPNTVSLGRVNPCGRDLGKILKGQCNDLSIHAKESVGFHQLDRGDDYWSSVGGQLWKDMTQNDIDALYSIVMNQSKIAAL